MKILHVITGLYTGGAETMLAKLLARMPRGEMDHAVLSLTGGGPIAARIAALGIPITMLGLRRGMLSPVGFLRLIRALRHHKPDAIQTWMYHANLLAGLAARFAGHPPVLWNIRQSNLDPLVNKRSTIVVARLGARWSRWLPDRIVCCAESVRMAHEALGYAPERMIVIPNGFDLDGFQPNEEARLSLRRELGLDGAATLVGLAARFDPQKDHATFLAAAGMLHKDNPDVNFLLCGDGIDDANGALTAFIAEQRLAGVCHLLGPRTDMARIMAGCDVVASSSIGEGFPNVLGEAMAAGTPCVATDVGESRLIVGEAGRIVPPRDPRALACALDALLALPEPERQALGRAARARIAEYYGIDAIAARYAALYRDTLAARG